MYALINGNELLLGPIEFNIRMINSDLEELELDYRVNSQDYQNVPITITDDVRIIFARNNIPAFDPRTQQIFQTNWEIIENEVVFNYEARDKPLDQIKDEFKALVPPVRYQKENTIISVNISGDDISISTDRNNRLALVTKLTSSDGPYNFKFNNGVWKDITKADLQSILSEIDKVVQSAFDWEYQKLQEIDSCSTPEEIFNVEIAPKIFLGENSNASA